MPEDHDLALALARIEVKIDTLIASYSDHESRLRFLERRGFVTARQMWAGIVGTGTVVSASAAAIALLTR